MPHSRCSEPRWFRDFASAFYRNAGDGMLMKQRDSMGRDDGPEFIVDYAELRLPATWPGRAAASGPPLGHGPSPTAELRRTAFYQNGHLRGGVAPKHCATECRHPCGRMHLVGRWTRSLRPDNGPHDRRLPALILTACRALRAEWETVLTAQPDATGGGHRLVAHPSRARTLRPESPSGPTRRICAQPTFVLEARPAGALELALDAPDSVRTGPAEDDRSGAYRWR